MEPFVYLRPASLDEAVAMARQHPGARVLAGGQSLLPAMRLGLNAPTHLIDLQDLAGLRDIRQEAETLRIGALVTHAQVARSPTVQAFCPMLAALAGGIADEQVRTVGTVGGSLSNNDPAACWPAGVLALDATLVTDRRELQADAFFQGLFATALEPGELLVGLRVRRPLAAWYHKQEQPASRFALVGLAVARLPGAQGPQVRVAITGLGPGVQRWTAAEHALTGTWSVAALTALEFPQDGAMGDVHASARYRAHLAGVLARRAVARLTGETIARAPAGVARGQPPPPARTSDAAIAAPGPAAPGAAAARPVPPPFQRLRAWLEHFLHRRTRR